MLTSTPSIGRLQNCVQNLRHSAGLVELPVPDASVAVRSAFHASGRIFGVRSANWWDFGALLLTRADHLVRNLAQLIRIGAHRLIYQLEVKVRDNLRRQRGSLCDVAVRRFALVRCGGVRSVKRRKMTILFQNL